MGYYCRIENTASNFFMVLMKDAYWDIASALAEADGIDYSDPEEVQNLNLLSYHNCLRLCNT